MDHSRDRLEENNIVKEIETEEENLTEIVK